MINKFKADPEVLELFVMTVETSNIAAAARKQNLAPSLATRKIAQLEKSLGVRIFERTTRSVKITEAGAIALRWAKQSLIEQQKVLDELSALQLSPSGLIRIVATQYAATELLPSVLNQFNELYPNIQFAITTTDSLLNLVETRYDIAIHSGLVPDSSVIGHRLHKYSRILCAAPSYLARYGTPTALKSLAQHHCLVHSIIEARNWSFRRGNRIQTQLINPFIEANNYSVIRELARQSLGIARLAAPVVKKDIEDGRLIHLLPDYECVYPNGEKPSLWILYPNRHILSRTRLLIDFLIEHLPI
jgi:hypothetical protein